MTQIFALWLTLALGLPNPAWALRQAGLEENAAKKFFLEKLRSVSEDPTAGLEEETPSLSSLEVAQGDPVRLELGRAVQALAAISSETVKIWQQGNIPSEKAETVPGGIFSRQTDETAFPESPKAPPLRAIRSGNPPIPLIPLGPRDRAVVPVSSRTGDGQPFIFGAHNHITCICLLGKGVDAEGQEVLLQWHVYRKSPHSFVDGYRQLRPESLSEDEDPRQYRPEKAVEQLLAEVPRWLAEEGEPLHDIELLISPQTDVANKLDPVALQKAWQSSGVKSVLMVPRAMRERWPNGVYTSSVASAAGIGLFIEATAFQRAAGPSFAAREETLETDWDALDHAAERFHVIRWGFPTGKVSALQLPLELTTVPATAPDSGLEEGIDKRKLWNQRPGFLAAVNYFNTVVLKAPELTWEHGVELFRLFREEPEDKTLARLRARSWVGSEQARWIQRRVTTPGWAHRPQDKILREAVEIYQDVAVYKGLGQVGEFLEDLHGFNTVLPETPRNHDEQDPASGHHRLAWFLMNYFLIRNGYAPFYFANEQEYREIKRKLRVLNSSADGQGDFLRLLRERATPSRGAVPLPPTTTGLEEEIVISEERKSIGELESILNKHVPWGFDYFDGGRERKHYMGGYSAIPNVTPWEGFGHLKSWFTQKTERTTFDVTIIRGDPDVPSGRTYAIIVGRPAAGLEESFRALASEAPRGVTPVLVGAGLEERYPELIQKLQGLEGVLGSPFVLSSGDPVEDVAGLIARGAGSVLFVGLEEQAARLKPLADLAGLESRVVVPGQREFVPFILAVLAESAGLEESVLAQKRWFGDLLDAAAASAPAA